MQIADSASVFYHYDIMKKNMQECMVHVDKEKKGGE
jgi:hypothetical protein